MTGPMGNYRQHNGFGHMPAYLVGGTPYVSSSIVIPGSAASPKQVGFLNVSKFVTIKCTSAEGLQVGFSDNGMDSLNNYFVLANNERFSGEWRIVRLHLRSNTVNPSQATVIAGLTTISSGEYPQARNWSGSLGVG